MRPLLFAASLLGCLILPAYVFAQSSHDISLAVTLPNTGLVFVLETLDPGQQPIVMHASEVISDAHAGSNFARGMVYAGPHSGVELDGAHADLTLHTASPIFYIRLASDSPDLMRSQATLISLRPTKDKRVVLDFSANVFGGSRKRHVDEVPINKADAGDGTILKITPQKPLEPGEYGIMFLPKDQMLFGATVYDFSVPGTK